MSTCINQKPLVKKVKKISKGDVIADGPATDLGELLGRNALVLLCHGRDITFEDSILISRENCSGRCFTSIHIEGFEVMARDTKLEMKKLPCDIPNVGEEALKT